MRGVEIGGGWRFAVVALPMAAVLLLLAGCGPKEPTRYQLTGKVVFHGAPVPRGSILFVPDAATGNEGLTTPAIILDGVYKTLPGKGTIGGPHVARVSGFDGSKPAAKESGHQANATGQAASPAGARHRRRPARSEAVPSANRCLATLRVKVNLPRQAGTCDIVVPEQ